MLRKIDKNQVIDACISVLRNKLMELEQAETEGLAEAADHGKSTAGDKHDTAQAMAHIERQQNSQFHQGIVKQLQTFLQPQWRIQADIAGQGALIVCDKSVFFLLVSIGKIEAADTEIMTVSLASPLGQKLNGKRTGDRIAIGSNEMVIQSIQ